VKVLILHLSDIHIASAEDPILAKGREILEAVRNLDYTLDGAVVVVSGDVAFSGTEDQYLNAMGLLEELCAGLGAYLNQPGEIPCVVVPGNHDCDFTAASAVRDMVLQTLMDEPRKLSDPDVVRVCTGVQEPFFQFLAATGGSYLHQDGRLFYEYSIPLGSETLLFRCYNTAVTSRREEKPGTLLCRFESTFRRDGAALVISVLHHPYNWLTPSSHRETRREIERTSDIVLTGHEHEHTRRVQHVATGETNEYIEGAVLQEGGQLDSSAFNVLVVDTQTLRQRFYHLLWRDNLYVPTVSHAEWEHLQLNRLRTKQPFEPAEQMQEFLDDPGLALTHRDLGRLKLSHVYVAPDLREVSYKGEQLGLLHGDDLVDRVVEAGTVLITGSEQSGKTALAKRLFAEFRRKGFVPLFVDCGAVRLQSPDHTFLALYRLAEEQYGAESLEQYRQFDKQRRVLILDNVHRLAATRTMRRSLVTVLRQFAGYSVLLANDLALQVEEVAHNASVPVKRYKIQQFGHLLRNQLVEKWLLLSPPDRDETQFVHLLTQVEQVLDTIIGKNFVPAYPVFILSVLQATETAIPIDLRASTNGYFYEMFIRAALAAGEDRQNYDVKTGYLAFLADRFFEHRWRDVSLEDIAKIHEEYQRLYHIKRPLKGLLEELVGRQVLEERQGRFSFKYKYIYYYFVATHLRDHITQQQTRDRISRMAQRVYVEENANILLFLAHLSRDPYIIDEMLREAARVYQEWKPTELGQDTAFLGDLLAAPLTVAYVEKEVDAARREMLGELDEHEAATVAGEPVVDPDLDPAAAHLDPVIRLNIALKAQQILGQILKNFPGSLEGDVKIRIAQECYGLGLRGLAAIFDLIKNHQSAIVDDIREFLSREPGTRTSEELSRRAQQTLGGIAHLIAYGIVKRISHSVGSPDLTETYQRLLPTEPSTALRLVNVSIRLDHFAGFPESDVVALAESSEANSFAQSLLKHMVVQRFYLFPADYKLKQRICAHLGIPYKPIQSKAGGRKLIPPPES